MRDVVVEDCRCFDNAGHGIFVEISGGFKVIGNVCVRNGTDDKWGNAGIALGESEQVTIENNLCALNPTGITIRELGPRVFKGIDKKQVSYQVRDAIVRHNVCALNHRYQIGLWWDNEFFGPHPSQGARGTPLDPAQANLRFEENLYWMTGKEQMALWGCPWRPRHVKVADLAAWQSRGHDAKSLAADPRFIGPAEDDWQFSPDSPAFRLGAGPPQGNRSSIAMSAAGVAARRFEFPEEGVVFSADFPAARLDACTRTAEGRYRLVVRPETTPINNSAWYAFRVQSTAARQIRLVLTYEGGSHRYAPKTSRDGKSWTPLARTAWSYDRKTKEALLELEATTEPLWVAAQEMVTAEDLNAWMDRLAALPYVHKQLVGRSVAERPIYELAIGSASAREHVVVIGRQHPPEITGSLALMAFVEAVAGDSPTALEFRKRFQVTVVPLVNPDGVTLGHWRCNRKGVDLNRDWVGFTQPETRAVRDEILGLAAAGQRMRLLLDFHSTGQDVFYTQTDQQKTDSEGFTQDWLAAIQARLPEYKLRRDAAHSPTLPTSKKWAFEILGIPAITYEVGDDTPRDLIRDVAQASAEEMMKWMTAHVAGKAPAAAPRGARRASFRVFRTPRGRPGVLARRRSVRFSCHLEVADAA